nr:MAG TPA: hypothetical protein [Microviridae sp.]
MTLLGVNAHYLNQGECAFFRKKGSKNYYYSSLLPEHQHINYYDNLNPPRLRLNLRLPLLLLITLNF